jgi:CRISPR-associated protein (TIGR02584 family)
VEASPSDHSPARRRRVLLAVSGLSPQIITETLYALAVASPEPWIPDEVHLITTAEGAKRASLALLSEEPGWFGRLLRDYGLPQMRFDPDSIHVIEDAAGAPMDDIRTPEQNELAADYITEQVRAFTQGHSELHVSIAGGRKTMGFHLGYALSLFGRAQDRLSHVLVSEPFESTWEFFYPTPGSRIISVRGERLADAAEARVTLADIPFVRLREGLPKPLLKGHASYSRTVQAARLALEPPFLELDLEAGRVKAGGEPVDMTPADLAFYAMFARAGRAGIKALRRGDQKLAGLYLAESRRIAGDMSATQERAEHALRHGMDEDDFDQRNSRANKRLQEALGPQLAARYMIQRLGRRGSGRYALPVAAERIRFTGEPA